ncbi:MAG: hypothetical protein HOP01_08950, partial [Gallionella sp.]|nr:hypothetical protein [Gallionella sp.]
MPLRHPLLYILMFSLFAPWVAAYAAEPDLPIDQTTTVDQIADTLGGIPAVVEADFLEGNANEIEMFGNAILSKGDQSIRADQLTYF